MSTESLTSLRLPGKPAFLLGKWEGADGEILSFIDHDGIIGATGVAAHEIKGASADAGPGLEAFAL